MAATYGNAIERIRVKAIRKMTASAVADGVMPSFARMYFSSLLGSAAKLGRHISSAKPWTRYIPPDIMLPFIEIYEQI
jgi:hypothetical protein